MQHSSSLRKFSWIEDLRVMVEMVVEYTCFGLDIAILL